MDVSGTAPAMPRRFRRRRRRWNTATRISFFSATAIAFTHFPTSTAAAVSTSIARRGEVAVAGVVTCPSGKFCYEATTCCGDSCCYTHETCTAVSPNTSPTCVSSTSSSNAALLFDTSAPPLVYPLNSTSSTSSSVPLPITSSAIKPLNISATDDDAATFRSPPGFASYPTVTKVFIILGPVLAFFLILLSSWFIFRWYRRRHPHKPSLARRSPRVASMIFLDHPPKGHLPISSVASPMSGAFYDRDRDPRHPPNSRGTGYTGYTSYAVGKGTRGYNDWDDRDGQHIRMGSVVSITAGNSSTKSGKTSSTHNKLRKSASLSRSHRSASRASRASTTHTQPAMPRPPQPTAGPSPLHRNSSINRDSSLRSHRSNSLSSRVTSGAYYSAPSTPSYSSKQFQIDENGMMVYTPPGSTLRNSSLRGSSSFSTIPSALREYEPPVFPRPAVAAGAMGAMGAAGKRVAAGPDTNDHSRVADVTRMLKELNESQTALAGPESRAPEAGKVGDGTWEVRQREDGVAEVRIREMRAKLGVEGGMREFGVGARKPDKHDGSGG